MVTLVPSARRCVLFGESSLASLYRVWWVRRRCADPSMHLSKHSSASFLSLTLSTLAHDARTPRDQRIVATALRAANAAGGRGFKATALPLRQRYRAGGHFAQARSRGQAIEPWRSGFSLLARQHDEFTGAHAASFPDSSPALPLSPPSATLLTAPRTSSRSRVCSRQGRQSILNAQQASTKTLLKNLEHSLENARLDDDEDEDDGGIASMVLHEFVAALCAPQKTRLSPTLFLHENDNPSHHHFTKQAQLRS